LLIWESFLIAFSALLPLINPLGSALVFLGLVGDQSAETYKRLARKIAVNNVIFLLIIEVLGSTILHFFGISLPIVQLSGGIVITSIGWGILNQNDSTEMARQKSEQVVLTEDSMETSLDNKAFYPFTFPVTSGPGTLVVMLTLSARSGEAISQTLLHDAGILLAVVLLSAAVWLCYAYAPRITKMISPTTAHGILRVMGFIVVCIGVQIAWNGLATLVTPMMKAMAKS
jgi:multiple antibiotic resistance protein